MAFLTGPTRCSPHSMTTGCLTLGTMGSNNGSWIKQLSIWDASQKQQSCALLGKCYISSEILFHWSVWKIVFNLFGCCPWSVIDWVTLRTTFCLKSGLPDRKQESGFFIYSNNYAGMKRARTKILRRYQPSVLNYLSLRSYWEETSWGDGAPKQPLCVLRHMWFLVGRCFETRLLSLGECQENEFFFGYQ